MPSTCLQASGSKKTRLASLLQLAQPVLFLPAASGFFYNADQSQTQSYDALFRKEECCHCKKKGRMAFAKLGGRDEMKG